MQLHITARHLNLTDAIATYLTRKIKRLERYFDHLVWANAILSVEKHRHIAEIIIHSPLHTMRAKAESKDLYAAIDLVLDKVEIQLKKQKDRWKHQNKSGIRRLLRSTRGEYAPVSLVLDTNVEEPLGTAVSGNSLHPSISVVKQVPVKPTGVEEAIQTMESLGYNFWMFLNKSTKRLTVIFRRFDQTYGLLEPAKK